ncbi:MAG TPA: SDR family oxidoreductase [Burkholderiales bacterium]|nr:SDR family oxidoreductase [Burkholderiales bacterium]
MNLGLANKVAAVTGGTEGIGRATVLKLVEEGAKVAFCARRAEPLDRFAAELRDRGGDVFGVPADASLPGEMERFIASTVERYGRIDILINNAGSTAQGPFDQADDEIWRYDLSVKLLAQVRAARAAVPHMRAQGSGRIINVAMSGAKQPPAASFPTSVSRAAGLAFTKALSKEVAGDGILVNAVALGWIKSRLQSIRAERAGLTLDEHYSNLASKVPLGRLGEPDEAASVIVFLASDLASYVTGSCINVDGGHSGVL